MGILKKKKKYEKTKKYEKRSKPTFKGFLTTVLATLAAIFLLIFAGLSLIGTAMAFIATIVRMAILKKKKKHEKRSKPTFNGFLTAVLATLAAIFLLILAGLSLTGTAVAFIATMPLFVVFSPVLVPAGITTGFLFTGLAAGGGAGLSALSIISWLFKYFTQTKEYLLLQNSG